MQIALLFFYRQSLPRFAAPRGPSRKAPFVGRPCLPCHAWLGLLGHPLAAIRPTSPDCGPPSPSCRRVTTYDVQTAMSTSPDCACRAVFSLFSHRRRFDAFDWMARRVSLRSGLGFMSVCFPARSCRAAGRTLLAACPDGVAGLLLRAYPDT